MNQPKIIIIVAGAQGNLGKLVCEALMARAENAQEPTLIRALVRKGSTSTLTASAHLEIHAVDYQSKDDLLRVCAGAYALISTLQGLEDVIVGVQSRLLEAAIACNVRRFIPSDFSGDFTKLPEGSHRNLDLRRRFHREAERAIRGAHSNIELTSIFQGGFTELLGSGWVLFDYKKRQVSYFGSADAPMEFTTWKNTAEFTAAAAIDANPTPRYLYCAGQRLSPRDAQARAKKLTGADFSLKRAMPVWMLRAVIAVLKLVKPGKKDEVMPLWVAMQYGYCGALGVMSPERLDNERYPEIEWASVDHVICTAFNEAAKA